MLSITVSRMGQLRMDRRLHHRIRVAESWSRTGRWPGSFSGSAEGEVYAAYAWHFYGWPARNIYHPASGHPRDRRR